MNMDDSAMPSNVSDESIDDDGAEGLDRRRFIRHVGVGAAVAGGAWVTPAIVGSSVAFAEGSDDGGPPVDPGSLLCGSIVWPAPTDNNPSKVGAWITYPITSVEEPTVSLDSVNGTQAKPTPATLVGPNPPSVVSPMIQAKIDAGNTPGNAAAFGYRNLMSNARPHQSAGTVSGSSVPGLLVVQNNEGGGNTSISSIDNYQQVTFTLSQPVYNLRFTIRDLSANTIDGSSTTKDVYNPSTGDLTSYGAYRDMVGFSVPVSVTGGNTTNLAGTGTFADPFRRTTADDWFWGLNPVYAPRNVPMDVNVAIAGPVSSFTLRYATVGGWGTQWIQLTNFEFGTC